MATKQSSITLDADHEGTNQTPTGIVVQIVDIPEGTLNSAGKVITAKRCMTFAVQYEGGLQELASGPVMLYPDNGRDANGWRPASAPIVESKAPTARKARSGISSLFAK